MKAIILALGFLFIVTNVHGKAPLEESVVKSQGFDELQENNYRVVGQDDNSEQQRIPSSDEDEAAEKEDRKPTPWNYIE